MPFLQFGKIINPPKEGLLMARELRCADLMPGCNFVAQGKDHSEVMKKAAEHAKSVRGAGVATSTQPDLLAK